MKAAQHLNYCRKYVPILCGIAATTREEPERFMAAASLMEHGVKFLLPHNGQILNDVELRALDPDEKLSLPFPTVALEFTMTWCDVTGAVVTAIEDDSRIHMMIALLAPRSGRVHISSTIRLPRKNAFVVTDKGALFDFNYGAPDEQGAFDAAALCCGVMLGFLNGLACENVRIERSYPRSAGRKCKSALPFDTYHILTVAAPSKPGDGVGAGGTHRSPREHIRRGHIRRLPGAGHRRIWVNASVVNAGHGKGVVFKDYSMEERSDDA